LLFFYILRWIFGEGPTRRFILLLLTLPHIIRSMLTAACTPPGSHWPEGHLAPLFLPHDLRAAVAVGHLHPNPPPRLSAGQERQFGEETYHLVKAVNVVIIIVVVVVVFVVLFREHVVFERLASEIVDSTRYDLRTSRR
jgi:hypothetical protein